MLASREGGQSSRTCTCRGLVFRAGLVPVQTIKVWKPLTKEPEISGARTLLFPVAFSDIQGSLVSVITLPAWMALGGGSPQLGWARTGVVPALARSCLLAHRGGCQTE